MLSRVWAAALLVTMATAAAPPSPVSLQTSLPGGSTFPAGGPVVSVVADNFTWAENLICDPLTQALFVSEWKHGELWRITASSPGVYAKHLHLGPAQGFTTFLGLALNGSTLFATADNTDKQHVVVSTPTAASGAGSFQQVATIPKRGNGMAFDPTTGLLYVTSEGEFLPFGGAVYRINVHTGAVDNLVSKGWTDDGAYIDVSRRLLYVSQVIGPKVLVINVDTGKTTTSYKPPTIAMLDDFTLGHDGSALYGADFWHGRVVIVAPADGSSKASGTILAEGFTNPTSARWGCVNGGPGLNTSSLFVSEGGGILSSTRNRRVLEVHGVRPPQPTAV